MHYEYFRYVVFTATNAVNDPHGIPEKTIRDRSSLPCASQTGPWKRLHTALPTAVSNSVPSLPTFTALFPFHGFRKNLAEVNGTFLREIHWILKERILVPGLTFETLEENGLATSQNILPR